MVEQQGKRNAESHPFEEDAAPGEILPLRAAGPVNVRLALEYEQADLLQRWAELEHSAKIIVDKRFAIVW